MHPQSVAALLSALVPDARAVKVTLIAPIAGGWSADTMRVRANCATSAGTRELDVVVRSVPPDGLLAPYDIERERRILTALDGSGVPVPAVVGCDAAGEYLGAPCLVTEFAPGESLPFFGQETDVDDRRLPAYYATLAAIHALDWAGRGLEFLGDSDDPLEPELRRDEARLLHHDCLGTDERAMLEWLRGHKPGDAQNAFIHGDPNPANYLFVGSRVTAVLDWELALVGDRRIDIGFFAAVQAAFGGVWGLDVASLVRGYAAADPAANLQHLDYFEAVGLFRLTGFLHAAARLRGVDASPLWANVRRRFHEITSGNAASGALPAAQQEE